jgi:hypothetical protein
MTFKHDIYLRLHFTHPSMAKIVRSRADVKDDNGGGWANAREMMNAITAAAPAE